MKLTESLTSLLLEIASIDTIQDAVNNRKVCIIYYDGDEPGGRGIREIEPVALGKSKAGNLVCRAWDREGASHTAYKGEQPLPGWRLFRLDKILSCKPSGEIYNTERPNYNSNGDKSMTHIITIAKFDNTTE
jgi:predicted DNA-binding transcriptional regulator YafY